MTKTAKLLTALVATLFVVGACSSDDGDVIVDPADPTTDSTDAESSTTEASAEDSTTEPPTSEATTTESSASADSTTESTNGESAAGTLAVTAVSFTNSTVTIRNDGAEAIDLTGYAICNRPNYGSAPDATVEPGATVEIDASSLDIRASGGEFGLYRSNSFDSADEIVAYVQWGGPGNGRSSVAVEAGLIAEGDFVDNAGEDIDIG